MSRINFSEADSQQIIAAIRAAESNTSAEIRVHLEPRRSGEPMQRAVKVFKKLKMDQTRQRNGVLLFLAPKKHEFAVVGDQGIHQGVPPDFWEQLVHSLSAILKNDNLPDGICAGIQLLGNELQKFFPVQADDVNELSDSVSIGE